MSKEQEDNQAEKLQQLFAEINNQPKQPIKKEAESELIEVDVLNLPPRSTVHQKSKLSLQMNIQRPLWRFLLVVVLLIAVLIGVYIVFGDDLMELFI